MSSGLYSFNNSANLKSKSYYAFLASFLAGGFPPFLSAYSLAYFSFSSSSSLIYYFILSSNSYLNFYSKDAFYSIPAILK